MIYMYVFFLHCYLLAWSATDFDAISSTHRALPLPPACALAIGLGSLSQRKDDAAEVVSSLLSRKCLSLNDLYVIYLHYLNLYVTFCYNLK